jgi:signal transduction histidine kinase
LFVKDSGIGISKEYFDTVFERFRKLNVDGNKVYRGTGLGLSITKKLVELLGGQIWIDSEPGVGTAFYFTLDGLMFRDVKA